MKIGFLFNHEGAHQVAHSAPIAFTLSQMYPDADVQIFYCGGAGEEELLRLAHRQDHRCRLTRIELQSATGRLAARLLGETVPVARIARLRDNRDYFHDLDALVVPEKTSLMLKTRFGLPNLKIAYTSHGAGDRAIGFDKANGKFDLLLIPGTKVRDRLLAAGHIKPESYAIVGYPKFDLVSNPACRPKFFDNGKPTVVYNPHQSPALSSWYKMGTAILDYFRHSDRYNLIFAPHVALFRKRRVISLDPFGYANVGAIDPAVLNAGNILVDTGSKASVDMTYVMAADIYLGDASSQVYEFLYRPRPCIFANPAGHAWQGSQDFGHWQAGSVVETIQQLDEALQDAVDHPGAFNVAQQKMFKATFDLTSEPSATRAAKALTEWIKTNQACA